MEDEIRKVEAQIEEVSKAIDGLYALKEGRSASFDSEKLQYLIKEKQDLRKKEEDLRKEKLLLLKKSITESESKLIYSFRYKILSGTDWLNNFTVSVEEKRDLNPNPPTAPPGNSITFPQVLPYSSIAFPFYLFPPPLLLENFSP